MLKEQGFPTRLHYFWPLLTQHVKDKNTDGMSLPLFLPHYLKYVRKPAGFHPPAVVMIVQSWFRNKAFVWFCDAQRILSSTVAERAFKGGFLSNINAP